MLVENIVENEDGSATIELTDLEDEEIRIFAEEGLKALLEIEEIQRSKEQDSLLKEIFKIGFTSVLMKNCERVLNDHSSEDDERASAEAKES